MTQYICQINIKLLYLTQNHHIELAISFNLAVRHHFLTPFLTDRFFYLAKYICLLTKLKFVTLKNLKHQVRYQINGINLNFVLPVYSIYPSNPSLSILSSNAVRIIIIRTVIVIHIQTLTYGKIKHSPIQFSINPLYAGCRTILYGPVVHTFWFLSL